MGSFGELFESYRRAYIEAHAFRVGACKRDALKRMTLTLIGLDRWSCR